MCVRVVCDDCQKPTYVGCGAHVEQVLGDVPREERCKCRESARDRDADEQSFLSRFLRW
jgi:hypothetical protein